MINPLKIYEYEPLDRTNLTLPSKVLVWLIEYIARMLGALYLSFSLIIISIWPTRSMTSKFFLVLGNVADMYRMKWMPDAYNGGKDNESDEREGVGKTDGCEVCKVEAAKQVCRCYNCAGSE